MPETIKLCNHPHLVFNWRVYLALSDYTDGSRARVAKYLIPYDSEADGTIEGKMQYSGRLRRLKNINFCGPFLKLHAAHMAQPITINGLDQAPTLEEITKDVTGFHDSYRQLARDRLYFYERDGRVGTLVDSAAAPAPDRAAEKQTKDRSYQVLYEARRIRYWEYFTTGPRKGQLKKLVLEEAPEYIEPKDKKAKGEWRRRLKMFEQEEPAAAPFQWTLLQGNEALPSPVSLDPLWSGQGMVVSQAQLWDDTCQIEAEEQEYEVIDGPKPGQLPYIPFVIWGEGPDESFIKDVVELNFAYMNEASVHGNILYNQGFQRLAAAGVKREEVTKWTEYCLTLFSNENARVMSIDPGDPAGLERDLQDLRFEINCRGKFEYNRLANNSKESPSAESKALDLVTRKAIYDETLDEQEEIEARIYQMHADYESVEAEITVSIGREYGLEDAKTETQTNAAVFAQARELGASELQWEILKVGAAKIRFISSEGETGDEVRERVLEGLDTGKNAPPTTPSTLPGIAPAARPGQPNVIIPSFTSAPPKPDGA